MIDNEYNYNGETDIFSKTDKTANRMIFNGEYDDSDREYFHEDYPDGGGF